MSEDDEPNDSERAEAEALARALDARASRSAPAADPPATAHDASSAHAQAPADALEAAALLSQAELSDVAARRVLEQVAPALRMKRMAARLKTLAAAATLLIVSGAALFAWRARRPIVAAALPRPSPALLAAQARAPDDAQDLDGEMSRYRSSLYAALNARYR